ncbi:hypothetical protein [Nonomuraea dietziae]|uniref:hypothetical protein n=1 Tax=Nonomuraea dietziae TaxID=65515 RepID=UPI0031D936CC
MARTPRARLGPRPRRVGPPHRRRGGLSVPWAIAFTEGGDALVTERDSGEAAEGDGRGAGHLAGEVERRPSPTARAA